MKQKKGHEKIRGNEMARIQETEEELTNVWRRQEKDSEEKAEQEQKA